jgi:FixJ family two-component response regulator
MEETPSVFVVDDDLRVQKALSNLISSAGFRVAAFGSASAFLDSEGPTAPGVWCWT